MSNTMWIDDDINAMPESRMMVATARALKARGIDYEWTHDGKLDIDADPEDLADDVMFLDAFEEELRKMVASDTMRELEEKGFLESTTDADGEIEWIVTEKANDLL